MCRQQERHGRALPLLFAYSKGKELRTYALAKVKGRQGGQRTPRPGGTFTVQETMPGPGETRGRRAGRKDGRNLLQGRLRKASVRLLQPACPCCRRNRRGHHAGARHATEPLFVGVFQSCRRVTGRRAPHITMAVFHEGHKAQNPLYGRRPPHLEKGAE